MSARRTDGVGENKYYEGCSKIVSGKVFLFLYLNTPRICQQLHLSEMFVAACSRYLRLSLTADFIHLLYCPPFSQGLRQLLRLPVSSVPAHQLSFEKGSNLPKENFFPIRVAPFSGGRQNHSNSYLTYKCININCMRMRCTICAICQYACITIHTDIRP